jgi:DNA invertase Pin-like site-specific DNA recombinase
MLFGYARTSTARQVYSLEQQREDLVAAGVPEANIYAEQVSSVAEREQLTRLLSVVRSGDVIVAKSLSRVARSVRHMGELIDALADKGVALRILDFSLDTSTAQGRLMLNVLMSVYQAEREWNLERQRVGIEKAKAEGKFKGGVPTARKKSAAVMAMNAAGVHKSEIAEQLGIGLASVYRILADEKKRQPKVTLRIQ